MRESGHGLPPEDDLVLKLHFASDQPFQLAAINAVADLFRGQSHFESPAPFELGTTPVLANRLDISEAQILENLRAVQARGRIIQDSSLAYIMGSREPRFPNFSIEMETGTGKTYVYLRTVMELGLRYGLRKFVVIVPSVAIREGVWHTIQSLKEHFAELYDGVAYHAALYDSGSLSLIRQFALSSSLELLVMTIDSFTRDTNIMRQPTDRFQGEVPMEMISRCRPVIILDEPQNMESELRVASVAQMDPLFALRYSATHRNPYNVVYRLTPYEAYRQNLVKRIEVAGLVSEGDAGTPLIRVSVISAGRRSVRATLEVRAVGHDGLTSVKRVNAKSGDDLERLTGNSEYAGYIVTEISAFGEFVAFANGISIPLNGAIGDNAEAVMEAQIAYTIEEHFRKAARLRPHGIKVLTLFFLNRVADYEGESPIVRELFNRSFREIARRYPDDWGTADPEQVQAAYFATRRTRHGEISQDSSSGSSALDREAYELIMRNKERLLSFEEPVCFIFSHSALREGWDSPNIFQICTLNRARSEIRKRQEVGRGVRLSVNQSGERVFDKKLNVLTVVANDSYERYVGGLQSETAEAFGLENCAPAPPNARSRLVAKLSKERVASEEFLELWKRINAKTRYAVSIDTSRLLSDVVSTLDAARIDAPLITVARAEVTADHDEFESRETASRRALATVAQTATRLPNVIDIVEERLSRTEPPVRVTRRTINDIISRTGNADRIFANLDGFANALVASLRKRLVAQIATGIKYEKTGEHYEMSQFDDTIESWADILEPVRNAIYDYVEVESNVEREFARALDRHAEVKVFAKLPSWFTVDTPVGTYNPDWAIVKEIRDAFGGVTGERLYLVRETKGSAEPEDLREIENYRIACAAKHFGETLSVDFKVITSIAEL